jgi:hypothetical protein
MKKEQALLIQQKKIMDAARIEPMTSRSPGPALKPLNHKDRLIHFEGIILPFG